MSNIYYLAIGKGESYAGRLYRMRPNAIHKETVGVGVTGYIVLSDEVVYYCDGDNVMKAKNWRGIELKLPENEELNEEGEIVTKISTDSNLPIVNEKGESLDVDVNKLPAPDEKLPEVDPEIKIETTINATPKNLDDGPVIPIIGDKPTEDKKDQVSPRVVEVEAPH